HPQPVAPWAYYSRETMITSSISLSRRSGHGLPSPEGRTAASSRLRSKGSDPGDHVVCVTEQWLLGIAPEHRGGDEDPCRSQLLECLRIGECVFAAGDIALHGDF